MKPFSAYDQLNERELPDDYPIYASYVYVADGEPYISNCEETVGHAKRRLDVKVITSCDLVTRADQKARWR